jgi:hypothetical protein
MSTFHNIGSAKSAEQAPMLCPVQRKELGIRASESSAGLPPSKIADVTSSERNASRSAWRTTLG